MRSSWVRDRVALPDRATLACMAQMCEICGKKPMSGHRISHAHNLTKRRWYPNLQRVRAFINGTHRRIRVCVSCLRSGKVTKAA